MTLDIRDVQSDELQAMLALTLSAYQQYEHESPPGFWDKYVTNITEAVLTAPDIERIAAYVDGEMAASVLLCKRSFRGNHPEIRLLAVSPDRRKLGLAGKLMQFCEDRLLERNCPSVILHTTNLMNVARRMYEKSGYVRSPVDDFSPVPGFVVEGYIKHLQPQPSPSRI
ncbi:MAG: GNAT family N-acetyltransferase [Candidatus Obscuribacterales bacterium]